MFTLNPQLKRDTFFIADLPLCSVLLMNNAVFPWIVLVPRLEKACEILDLARAERHRLMDEIALASEVMRRHFKPYKLNVAALGNHVPQLHLHVIARYTKDKAWPNPVWGAGRELYMDAEPLRRQLEAAFASGARAV